MNKGLTLLLISVYCTTLYSTPPKAKYCKPTDPCWPTEAQWKALDKEVNGHLIKASSPLTPCIEDSKSKLCSSILNVLKNPFAIEKLPEGTQSTGWLNAWSSQTSPYIVAVEDSDEIASAINFAREHHIKLVVKGTGHDYLGRSNAPDSLLIWTHRMRKIAINKHFIPLGCTSSTDETIAVTAQAGTRWLEAYKKVVIDHGRYVQGGGCTTVGVSGGFIQGGGFGSFSKKWGTGAAGILEAEIVTADGKILTVNACQNQDLFWALKGGGGGTFGVVSKVTLQTHPLPKEFGVVDGLIKAKSEQDYKNLIHYFLEFYRMQLHNEHWGEQAVFSSNNELKISMVFQGLNQQEAKDTWQPLIKWLKIHSKNYEFNLNPVALPAQDFWNIDYLNQNFPNAIIQNTQKGISKTDFWWSGNQSEVSIYLTHYQSGYLPFSLFNKDKQHALADALYKASRLSRVSLHFNKGLSGASQDAISRQKDTAMHPGVLDAAALVIISGGQQYAFPSVPALAPNQELAQKDALNAQKAMNIIHQLSPNSGTYPNEADYFLKFWPQNLWGPHYNKLLAIKKRYDPDGIFSCHHCVGSNTK